MAAWDHSKLPFLQENCSSLPRAGRTAPRGLRQPPPAPSHLDPPALVRSFHLQHLKDNMQVKLDQRRSSISLLRASGSSMDAHGNNSSPPSPAGSAGGQAQSSQPSGEASSRSSSPFPVASSKPAVDPLPSDAPAPPSARKKASKKRSRVSRRPPPTILEADSSNFREMVQHLTGIPSPFFSSPLQRRRFLHSSSNLPPTPPLPLTSFDPRHTSGSSPSTLNRLLHPTLPSSFNLFTESSQPDQQYSSDPDHRHHHHHELTPVLTEFQTVPEDYTNYTDLQSVFQSLGYSEMASLTSSLDESPYLAC